jgi:hypothetical protein
MLDTEEMGSEYLLLELYSDDSDRFLLVVNRFFFMT